MWILGLGEVCSIESPQNYMLKTRDTWCVPDLLCFAEVPGRFGAHAPVSAALE